MNVFIYAVASKSAAKLISFLLANKQLMGRKTSFSRIFA